jgi:hypothetical protein
MITQEQIAQRQRRHKDLKAKYEVQLDNAETDAEKKHLEARIAEITSNMKPVSLPEPKALLPKITKTAEDAAKGAKEDVLQPSSRKPPKPKPKLNKIKNVGNPF